jgi:WD40 repeat protein
MARHLALITTHGPHHISCAALSPDGSTVAVADAAATRLFALEARGGGEEASTSGRQQQQELVVRRHKLHGQAAAPSVAVAFAADGGSLIVADVEGVVRSIAVDSGEVGGQVDLQQALAPTQAAAASRGREPLSSSSSSAGWLSQGRGTPLVRQLAVSPDGQWLAVTTGGDQVVLVTLPSLTVAGPLLRVGTPGAAVTAVTFSPDSSMVVVATDANDCSAYSVSSRQPSEWSLSQQEALSDILEQLPGSIRGVSFDPAQQVRPREGSGAGRASTSC